MLLVTGATGFIGSVLIAELEAIGAPSVVACDWFSDPLKLRNIAKRRNIAMRVEPEGLQNLLAEKPQEIEGIFHLGAISSTTAEDNDHLEATNVQLPNMLWRFAADHDLPFIYASSASTYGYGELGFEDKLTETQLQNARPLNPYGRSKHRFDLDVLRMLREGARHPKQWAGLKFFNVYGPNEYHKAGQRSVVAHLVDQIRAKGSARLFRSHNPDYKDGEQARDFVWVGDCARIAIWLWQNPTVNGLFNVGSGRARTFLDLARLTFSAMHVKTSIEWVETPKDLQAHYQYFTEANMDKLRENGFGESLVQIEEGVPRYVQDYLLKSDPHL